MSQEQEFDYEYEYDDQGEIVYYAVRPNKTRIKKDMAVLFALSEELSELPPAQLKALELPDNIHKALTEASGMPHKGARKRLLKFITGQLNKIVNLKNSRTRNMRMINTTRTRTKKKMMMMMNINSQDITGAYCNF